LSTAAILVVISLLLSSIMWSQWTSKSREAQTLRHETQLSQAREAYSRYDLDSALAGVETLLDSPSVGPQARLLYASILVDGRYADQAIEQLEGLLTEAPEIAGAAHALLGRVYWESDLTGTEKLNRVQDHRTQAERLLPDQPEAYLLRAMTSLTIKDRLGFLDRALALAPQHYECRQLRALTYLASRRWDGLAEDALVMSVTRPGEAQAYLLSGIAKLHQHRFQQALNSLDRATQYSSKHDSQWLDIQQRRCEGLLKLGRYPELLSQTKTCLQRVPDETRFHFYLFCAYTALGQYERGRILFQDLTQTYPGARNSLIDWAIKHVSESARAGRAWHPSSDPPAGLPYLWMLEAEPLIRARLSQGSHLMDNGFHTDWSPDGQKLAFSFGVHGYSGLAVYDVKTQQTELLIVPGKDPEWSPDGKTIAFVRDCQVLPISDLISAEFRYQHRSYLDEEVWLINADGTEPRRVDHGGWPGWSADSSFLYYCSRSQYRLKRIAINDPEAKAEQVASIPSLMASVSPDGRHLAFVRQGELLIQDMTDTPSISERWKAPAHIWGGHWLPSGRQIALGGGNNRETFTGLWIYDLDRHEARQHVSGRVVSADWSDDGQRLSFCLGPPFYEIWTAQAGDLGAGIDSSQYAQHMGQLYENRIKHDPKTLSYHKSLCELLIQAGQYQEAHRSLEAWGSSARQQSIKPDREWSILMAMSLAQVNRTAEARTHLEQYRQACYRSTLLDYALIMKMIAVEKRLAGESTNLYAVWDHLENRRPRDAATQLDAREGQAATDAAAQASLQNAGVLCALGQALQHYMQQDWVQLTEALKQGLGLRDDLALFHSWLALIYASHPDDGIRQASQALHHATRTLDIMGNQDMGTLQILATAHAEAGDFEKAVSLEERALELLDGGLDASAQNQAKAAMQKQLELYRNRQPSRATQWIR
jgi:Tol biopolymer transport system component